MIKKATKAVKAKKVKVEKVDVPKVEEQVVKPHVVTRPYDGTVNTQVSEALPSLND